TVQRHTLALRIIHWVNFAAMVLLLITGFEISGLYELGGKNVLGFFNNVHELHVWIGGFWLAAVIINIYYLSITGAIQWEIPNIWGIKYLYAETMAWLGFRSGPGEPIKYDVDKKKFIRKVDPGVWIDFWGFAILTLLIGLTGVMQGFPDFLTKVGFHFLYTWIGWLGSIFGVNDPMIATRILHLFLAYLFVALIILHVYSMAILHYLSPMVTGKHKLNAEEIVKA
ncbi:MAG TPA: cytochrome b/b6 domain-containing protein, partial [archaeon]|nr:cytochrome b/b6 domain-containing protein [archaeon]